MKNNYKLIKFIEYQLNFSISSSINQAFYYIMEEIEIINSFLLLIKNEH